VNTIKGEQAASQTQCLQELATPELDPIRRKVELSRNMTDGPPPFEIASNDAFPADSERVVIAKWATLRDACVKRSQALLATPPSSNAAQAAFFQQDISFSIDVSAQVGKLIVALYQQKLTYGEFAQKRYEIGSQASAAELVFRQSAIDRDHQRQMQAQQQFANSLAVWATYMQAVEARQPQTVNINGTIRVQ